MASGRDGVDEAEEEAGFVLDLEDREGEDDLEEEEEEEGEEEGGEEEKGEEEGEEEEDDDDDDLDEGIEDEEMEEENTVAVAGCSTDFDREAAQLEPQFERADYEMLAARKRKAIAEGDMEDVSKKARQDLLGVSQDELMEVWNYGRRRRRKRKEEKKRGRRKGSKKKRNPEVTKLLGEATILYVHDRHAEAIRKLHEVIRLVGDVPEAYHTLALVHDALGNTKLATEFYTIVASLSRGDSSLWKLLFSRHLSWGNTERAIKCLYKAVAADPSDIALRARLAMFYEEHADYQKAGKIYEQIVQSFPNHPDTVEALMRAAELYLLCGQIEQSINILEEYLKCHPSQDNASVLNALAAILMEINAHDKALKHLEGACLTNYIGKKLRHQLKVKAGICYLHLGDIQKAELQFSVLQEEKGANHIGFLIEAADAFMDLQHFHFALKYYRMLEGIATDIEGYVHLKIAHCCLFLGDRGKAIAHLNKALKLLEDNVEARTTLASLMLEDGKEDEAIALLLPPPNSDSIQASSDKKTPWWNDGKVKIKLCKIYRSKGMLEDFVNTIFPFVRETLYVENVRPRHKGKKRLSESVLRERSKILDVGETDDIFGGVRPLASQSELLKARRARKALQKKEEHKDADFVREDENSDDEYLQQKVRAPPLPKFLKDQEHLDLVIELCKALQSLKMFWEALEIIDLTRRLAHKHLPTAKKEELQSLAAQISYHTMDPKYGFECVKSMVLLHPLSFAAWNNYYKIALRLKRSYSRHAKFLRHMRTKYSDCVPPILISGHQFTMGSHHQDAVREYLEAYKRLPENPLINLCVGTALVNLALGFRLQKKHQCVAQGLAFFFNNLRLAENSQEALYNIARAYHHIGMVTLAAAYYEKVLATRQEDCPIPKLLNENSGAPECLEAGHCNLQREAAYNLHLIYKRSGASELARQVLKDHLSFS